MANDGYKDKAKGFGNKVKGEAKEQWGNITNDNNRKSEGKFDKVRGEAQNEVGETKEKFSNRNENKK
ncbi:CsbD family protein [Virgibacillus necropolis]|uniref:CsbD-like domain-containing protein n=1 Tax=Virgibacillus necropolis TaxID=163877 RepID=A0A221MER6_9BACI|nr:CsbD family protein [Virgibacillus necropolis]ASN06163.1 hypothetical protein CFK40_14610 [Virgibacillus necropolis]